MTSFGQRCRLVLLLCCACVIAKFDKCSGEETAPRFLWAQQFSSTYAPALGFAVDSFGNSYATGTYRDELRIGGHVLTNSGGVFLVKVDRNGQVLWARRDGDRFTEGWAVGVDGGGNIYLLCYLGSTSAALPIAGTNVNGPLVLAKYTADGEGVWARRVATGSSIIGGSRMAVALDGGTYWSVFLGSSATFIYTNISISGPNGALVKCDPDGNVVWVKSPPSGNFTWLADPALDSSGNLFVGGRFSGTIDLGSSNLTSAGTSDLILTKWTSGGELLWARQAGGNGGDDGQRIDIDTAGNCIVSGTFYDYSVSNGPPTNLAVLIKYDGQGNQIWMQMPSGSPSRTAAATDGNLNCYLAAEAGTNLLCSKYSPSGELQWSRTLAHQLRLFALRADAMGHCYVYGTYSAPTLTLDDITLTRANPNANAVLAKLDTTTRPRLDISTTADVLELSWSLLASGFYLESTPTPTDPQSWSSNSAVPSSSGPLNRVTFPVADKQFYRLRR